MKSQEKNSPEDPFDRIDKLLLQQLDSEKLGDNECYNAGIKFKKKLKKNNNCLIIEKGKNSRIVTFANYIKNNVISLPWKKKYRQIENILEKGLLRVVLYQSLFSLFQDQSLKFLPEIYFLLSIILKFIFMNSSLSSLIFVCLKEIFFKTAQKNLFNANFFSNSF